MGRTNYDLSTPAFIVDLQSIDRDTGRQIDWANIPAWQQKNLGANVIVVVGAAGAAGGATSVPVGALSAAIPNGTTLDFGGAKFARLTAAAAAGALTLTVAALPTALVSTDTATYTTAGTGGKFLKAGTCVGDVLGSGKLRPRVVTTNPAVGFLASDASELSETDAITGYGLIIGGYLYENLLPDATGGPPAALAAGIKTELQVAGASKGFLFKVYEDTRT
jgi:hypothetical protein